MLGFVLRDELLGKSFFLLLDELVSLEKLLVLTDSIESFKGGLVFELFLGLFSLKFFFFINDALEVFDHFLLRTLLSKSDYFSFRARLDEVLGLICGPFVLFLFSFQFILLHSVLILLTEHLLVHYALQSPLFFSLLEFIKLISQNFLCYLFLLSF